MDIARSSWRDGSVLSRKSDAKFLSVFIRYCFQRNALFEGMAIILRLGSTRVGWDAK